MADKPPIPDGSLEAALAVAIRFLGTSARSTAEVQRRLNRAGFDDGIIQAAVAQLTDRGWLNDAAFAAAWIADRAARKAYGRLRLGRELRQRGVANELIAAALEPLDSTVERDYAMGLVMRRLDETRLYSCDKSVSAAYLKRLAGMLARRGFSSSVIAQVFRDIRENLH